MFQKKQKANLIPFSTQYITNIRSNHSQMFFEIGIIKVCNIHRKTPVLELHAWSLVTLLKRDSNTEVLLLILRSF